MTIDYDEIFRRRQPRQREVPFRLWLLVVVVFLVLFGGSFLINVLSEGLWFSSLGQLNVYAIRLLAPIALFAVTMGVSWVWLAANGLVAAGRASAVEVWPGQLPAAFRSFRPRSLILAASGLVSLLIATAAAGSWDTVLLALHATGFDVAEPILGRDASFYIFTLPVLHLARGAASALVATAFLGAAIIYAVGGLLHLRNRTLGLAGFARGHLGILGAVWALLWAAGEWLARYDLLLGGSGGRPFSGPGYTDIVARLPAHAILAVLGLVLALLFLLAIGRSIWLAVVGVAAAVTLQVLLLGVYPGLLQSYRVVPNELERERPYIANNITLTLQAHNLDQVNAQSYNPTGNISRAMLSDHASTLGNIRLWDWRVLETSFQETQAIRPFYTFLDVDIDRYHVGGDVPVRQVELAPREMDARQIQNRSWVNLHLAFTHGFGVVAAPVNEVDPAGNPILWIRDIPPDTDSAFPRTVTQPRVYFGEAAGSEYVVAGSPHGEFDYPSRDDTAETSYDGLSGVRVGSWLRRALFAARFGDSEILLSDSVTPDSRLQMHRQISDRVRTLAPFLRYDPDPYLVVTEDGRLVWLYDAYTVTDRFPYAERIGSSDPGLAPLNGANYVRNSVKITIDAYDGVPKFYVVDPNDPLIEAWQGIFPDLFRPVSEMPPDLVAHWRYPEAQFRAQAEIYSRYHMLDPLVFYNGEDLWQIPTEDLSPGQQMAMQPYYVTIQLRGEEEAEFLLMLPFSPFGKPNMISWMAARCDPGHYGELTVYDFSKGKLVYGPQQVESRVNQDPVISQQLTLWGQQGSQVTRGNLLVIPVDDSVLYVEPLYLQAERGAIPQLKQVIVASGDAVVMRPSLEEALTALVAGEGSVLAEGATPPEAEPSATPGGPSPPPPTSAAQTATAIPASAASGTSSPETMAGVVRRLRETQDAANRALQAGDWEEFGRQMRAKELLIRRLEELTGVSTAVPGANRAAATPTPLAP